jgi:hypothetical protein
VGYTGVDSKSRGHAVGEGSIDNISITGMVKFDFKTERMNTDV